jgi:hypothetical protein
MRNLLIATLASMTVFVTIGAAQNVNPPIFDQSESPSNITVSAQDSQCTFFRLPNHDAIFIECFQGSNEVLNTKTYPKVGQTVMGGLVLPKATFGWSFTQMNPGVFTFVITANGSTRMGTL